MAKRALITGVTGQDGSYLAEFLLDAGLHGRSAWSGARARVNFERIAHIQDQIELVAGDLLDEVSLINILRDHRPDRGLQPGRPVLRPDQLHPAGAHR